MPDPGELRHTVEFDGDKMIVSASQWTQPILDRNVMLQNTPELNRPDKKSGGWHLIGSIPNIMVEWWLQKEGVNIMRLSKEDFSVWCKRILNDPDYRKFKTVSGKV